MHFKITFDTFEILTSIKEHRSYTVLMDLYIIL
jgi:hypothetical protein